MITNQTFKQQLSELVDSYVAEADRPQFVENLYQTVLVAIETARPVKTGDASYDAAVNDFVVGLRSVIGLSA